ncbi:hypothetical protein VNO77_14354 [Canavalia gladiata]|uniref:Uncharacterized protein n=1 Tax=Canavalia gladiata TaxID=3824 RepID=A0AAN9QQX9_CANGL
MASFATHFSGSVLLFPIALRRLLSSTSLFLQNPSNFRSKLWYFSNPNLKNLDLYALLIVLPIASFSHLFLFFSLSSHPAFTFSFFHQSLILFAFWLLLLFIIAHNYLGRPLLNQSFLFLFAGVVFLMEYSNIGKGVSGLAASVYALLGRLTLVCAAACIYLSFKPCAFFAEFLLSCGLVFKGTWVMQVGVSLYTDAFGVKGCQKIAFLDPLMESVDMHCDLDEDRLRGAALMHLLFTVHAIVVMVLGVGVFGLVASNRGLRVGGEARGALLGEIESASARMQRAVPELEME